ncbi:MAG: hypothetical protein LUH19_00530, partial [Lachnospiraceae bacterium]|nr:hypothetical protein [Lachnospiraceae bacterium]
MADRAFDERQGQLNEVIRQAAERGLELTKDLLPMDEQTMRRLERRWDQFDAAMMRRVVTAVRMLSAKSQEEDEEVPSQFGYLKGYKQVHMGMEQLTGYVPKSVSWQIGRLHEILPQLGDADETIAERPLPEGAESWFAIPRWELLAPTYGEAVEKALDLINQFSPDKIYSYRTGRLGPEYLRP